MTADRGTPRDETIHHYLETIFYISHEGEIVRPSRLAEWLGVSPPTVSVTLQRLERDGWITIAADRSVEATPAGVEVAEDVVRRHRLLERWLTDALGFDWATADEEAQRLVEGMSVEVADRLDTALGHPNTCPHGNVIPGREAPYGELVSLAAIGTGSPAKVCRISEVAEHDAPQLLRDLEKLGITPGATVVKGAEAGVGDALMIDVDGKALALGADVAGSIWVEPAAS